MSYAKNLVAAALLLGLWADPASADQYVFALSWQPAFCQSHRDKAECRTGGESSFAASHLTLHGLWPQSGSYCQVPAEQKQADENHRWNQLPAVALAGEERAKLEQYMPGARSNLDRHEWTKHGTCSGLSADQYFSKAVALAEQVDGSEFNKIVAAAVGGVVPKNTLKSAVNRSFGGNAVRSLSLICAKGGVLQEVRFTLNEQALQGGLSDKAFVPKGGQDRCPAQVKIAEGP